MSDPRSSYCEHCGYGPSCSGACLKKQPAEDMGDRGGYTREEADAVVALQTALAARTRSHPMSNTTERACPCGIPPESASICSAGTCDACRRARGLVATPAQPAERTLAELADLIEGNHITSGSPGPLYSMGWSDANKAAAKKLRQHIAATPAQPPALPPPAVLADSLEDVIHQPSNVVRRGRTTPAQPVEPAGAYDELLRAAMYVQSHGPLAESLRRLDVAVERVKRDRAALAVSQPVAAPQPEPTHAFEPRDLSYDTWVDIKHRSVHTGHVTSIVCAKCGRYEDHPTHSKEA